MPGASALELELVRELEPGDVATLLERNPFVGPQATVKSLRAAHHRLAQVLANGATDAEAALATGYSVGRVTNLRTRDPSFQGLLAHYGEVRDIRFAEINELMLSLGRTTLEELIEQMELRPESFSTQQKMDLFELMAVKGRAAPGSAVGKLEAAQGAAASGLTMNIKFVTPGQAEGPTITIDQEPVP